MSVLHLSIDVSGGHVTVQNGWWSPAFLQVAEHLPASGRWWMNFLFCLACTCGFSLPVKLSWSQLMSFLYYFSDFLFHLTEGRVSERLRGAHIHHNYVQLLIALKCYLQIITLQIIDRGNHLLCNKVKKKKNGNQPCLHITKQGLRLTTVQYNFSS